MATWACRQDTPRHGVHYNDLPTGIDAHGGLTYSDACDEQRICHVPEPGEPDNVWWLGFDCYHAFDLAPSPRGLPVLDSGSEYRTVGYARAETERLAEQLAAMGKDEA